MNPMTVAELNPKADGLWRGSEFRKLLELELRRSRRYQYFASLLIIEANSVLVGRLGKGTGDVLQKIAALLRKELRETDLVGLQNERFVTVLLPYSDRAATRCVAGRLTSWLAGFLGGEGLGDASQVKVGGASFPSHATDLDSLIQRAGEMLSRASFVSNEAIQILE